MIINILNDCPIQKKAIEYLYKILNVKLLRCTAVSAVRIYIGFFVSFIGFLLDFGFGRAGTVAFIMAAR